MSVTKVKRSQIATFVNTTPSSSSATYKLLGVGVLSGEVDMGPKTTEETWINEDVARVTVDSYAPKMPVDMTCVPGDPVFDYIEGLKNGRAVLSDAETDIVNVWMYKTSAASKYPAEKQSVAIQVDKFGGDGGVPAKISFTFNYAGTPTSGSYSVSSNAFS